MHLDCVAARGRVGLDLAPADGLIGARARVAAVELVRRVHVHGRLSAVAHEACVGDVVLDEPAAEHNYASAARVHGERVDAADVADNVNAQAARRGAEGVEVEHVAEAAVGQRGAEDGDAVARGPVAHGRRVGDLAAEAMDDLAGRPDDAASAFPAAVAFTIAAAIGIITIFVFFFAVILVMVVDAIYGLAIGGGGGGAFLLVQHAVEDGYDPVLKGAVVAVGHVQVADAVDAALAQRGARMAREGAQVRRRQALDQILLDAAGCRHDGRHVPMLHEVAKRLAQARRDEVRCVAEEDGCALIRRRISPCALENRGGEKGREE